MIYQASINYQLPDIVKALIIALTIYWVTIDPTKWTIITTIYLIVYTDIGPRFLADVFNRSKQPEEKETIEQKNEVQVKNKPLVDISKYNYLINPVLSLLVTGFLFLDKYILKSEFDFLSFCVVSALLIFEGRSIYKTRKFKLYHLVIAIIIVPTFLSYSVINKLDYSLIGISKSYVEILKQDEERTSGILIFQDSEYLYLKESLSQESTIIIPKNEVKLIKTNKLKSEKKNSKSIQSSEPSKTKVDTKLKIDSLEGIIIDTITPPQPLH